MINMRLIEQLSRNLDHSQKVLVYPKTVEDAVVDYANMKLSEKLTLMSNAITQTLKDAKAYSDNSIANIIGQAPEALDTVYELAEALQTNQSSISILNQAITTKVPIGEPNTLISTYIHQKNGRIHNFVGNGTNGRLKVVHAFSAGDTFQVNGVNVIATCGVDDVDEDVLPVGRWVTFVFDGAQINFKGGGGISSKKLSATTAIAGYVLAGNTFYSKDKILKTGTMPNISAFDAVKSIVESQGTLYCRMSYGAHITNASSGYPELMIPMSSFGGVPASKVLKNQTFTSSSGLKISGTMPDNSGVNTNGTVPGVNTGAPSDPTRQASTTLLCSDTAGTKRFNLRTPEGYYSRNSWINIPANNLGDAAAAHVLEGKTFTSSNGVKIAGTIPIEKIDGVVALSANSKDDYYFYIRDAYYQGGASLKVVSLFDQTKATALPSHILSGKTAWVDGEKITGSMENKGNVSVSLNCGSSYTIPKGYHEGGGMVSANSLANQTKATALHSHILSGKTAWVDGEKITGTLVKGDYSAFRYDEVVFTGSHTFPGSELSVGSSDLAMPPLCLINPNMNSQCPINDSIYVVRIKTTADIGSKSLDFYVLLSGGFGEFTFKWTSQTYSANLALKNDDEGLLSIYTESSSKNSIYFATLTVEIAYAIK